VVDKWILVVNTYLIVVFFIIIVVFTSLSLLHDPQALNFIKKLGVAMHSVNSGPNPSRRLQLILVISPVRSEKLSSNDFGPEDLKQLGDSVDGFSLMTYDFSGPQKPGPNAPLEWINYSLGVLLGNKGTGHAHMIFLGINFYGNDFVIAEGESSCLNLNYAHQWRKFKAE
jgi:chitinase domain-containing protein 1